MRDGIRTAMTGIVHYQCSLLHLLSDKPRHIGITVACRGGLAGIGIPHDALHLIGRIERLYQLSHTVGIVHVGILVTIVAHKADQTLPCSGMMVA